MFVRLAASIYRTSFAASGSIYIQVLLSQSALLTDLPMNWKRQVTSLQSRRLTTTALSTAGWGEFEIGVLVEFHDDVVGPPIAMSHSLKLYTTSFAKAWTERTDR